MDVYPAIDILGGRCVRLQQGDFERQTVFGDSPAEVAGRWAAEGAVWIHVVDLDGAREGRSVNAGAVAEIARRSGARIQLGGGIRTIDDIERALALGVERVVLGSAAVDDPDFVPAACSAFPGRIAAAIDARNGRVASHGWERTTEFAALDLAKLVADAGVAAIVHTDIERDGMLGGANVAASAAIARSVDVPVIASGGVTSLEDVRALAEAGLGGVIIGRALYTGAIDLREAIAAAAGAVRRC